MVDIPLFSDEQSTTRSLADDVFFHETFRVRVERVRRAIEEDAPRPLFTVDNLMQIQRTTDVGNILEQLLELARPYGICRIRFDHLDHAPVDREILTSFECAGFDEETALRLRTGHAVAFRDAHVNQHRDAFCCIDEQYPTLFKLLADGPSMHFSEVEDLSLYQVSACDGQAVAPRADGAVWVDIPLIVAQQVVGKVSCDLVAGIALDAGLVCDVLDFNTIVQAIAPTLELAYHHQLEAPLGEVAMQVANCTTLTQLLDYCVGGISRLLGCEYGSVLVASTDTMGSTKLILRRTSFSPSRGLEDKAYYAPTEEGITPWIFRSGVSLCLQDLGNDEIRLAKLRAYDSQVKWKNKIHDSHNSGDFLGTQLPNGMGVMRFTTKVASDGRHFTVRDQRLLETIAQRLIAPKLAFLLQAQSQRMVSEHLHAINTFSVQASTGLTSFSTMLHRGMEQLFPEGRENRKLWVFNLLKRGVGFRQMTMGGSLPARADRAFRLPRTFTRYVMDKKGAVFLNSLDLARQMGNWDDISEHALCALACRVSMFDKNYGVLVVLSDRYDISLQTHGQLLEMLASRVAEVLLHRDAGRLAADLLGRKTMRWLLPELREQVHRMLLNNDGFLTAEGVRQLDQLRLPTRRISLQRVIKTVAATTAVQKLRLRVNDDVTTNGAVAVQSGAILLNLLRQFAQWSDSDAPVTIDASIENGKLRIALQDDCGRINLDLLRQLLQIDLSQQEAGREQSRSAGGLGIYEARRLVQDRGGSMDLVNAKLTVRLPCDSNN